MAGAPLQRLGLVVRHGAWRGRSGREPLDVAIAAASMGVTLDLFFTGEGVLQLLAGRSPGDAGLPAAASAWTSLPELGPVRFHVDSERARALQSSGHDLLVDVIPVTPVEMRERQSACDRLLVA